MKTTLSSKGQVVLRRQARLRSGLQPGTKFSCIIEGRSIILRPDQVHCDRPKLVTDHKTGLRITQSPRGINIRSKDVEAAMVGFL